GDFDYNGIVDFDDYSLIDFAFNTQDPQARAAMSNWVYDGSENRSNWAENGGLMNGPQSVSAASGNFVPEPGIAGIFVLMVGVAIFRRRQKFPEIFPCVGRPVPNIFRVAE